MTSRVIYEGELRTVATHIASGSQIGTDAPVDNQGKGEQFSPTDLVATSLASCMLTIMGQKARDLGVDLRGTLVDVEKIMKSDPRRIGGINVSFHFPETLTVTDKQRVILERAAHTCPVAQSLNPEIVQHVVFYWNAVPA